MSGAGGAGPEEPTGSEPGERGRGIGAGGAGPGERGRCSPCSVRGAEADSAPTAAPLSLQRGPRRARAPSMPRRRSAPPGTRPPQALSIFPRCPAPQILQPRSLPQRLMRRRAAARHRLSQGSADPLPERRREQQEAQLSASVQLGKDQTWR